jgi:hypothetical protein
VWRYRARSASRSRGALFVGGVGGKVNLGSNLPGCSVGLPAWLI